MKALLDPCQWSPNPKIFKIGEGLGHVDHDVRVRDRKKEGLERERPPVLDVQIADGDDKLSDDDPVAQVEHLKVVAVQDLGVEDQIKFTRFFVQ